MTRAPSILSPSVERILSLQREAVAGLLRSRALAKGDVDQAIAEVTEAASQLLSVDRASVWRFDEARTRIDCLDLWEAGKRAHSRGVVIRVEDAPAYFAAALEERVIAAHEAQADPRTREFTGSYLQPLGITSMLDAPIIVRGQLVGVLCHEHVGPQRRWEALEELVAGTLADFVGMALSASEHAEQARALEVLHGNLEKLVDERTSELRSSQENVRALFEASPVALVLTRVADQRVLLVNDRAAAMFEVVRDDAAGLRAPDFWTKPEDRAQMIRAVSERGFVDGLEVELKSSSGRRFWGALSAKVVSFEGDTAMLVGVHDITATKRAADAVRASEEALRTLLEAAPTPLVVAGIDDQRVRYGNKRASDIFGTTPEAFVGKFAPDCYEDPEERAAFVTALREHGSVDGFAARLRTFDGRGFWALLSARTMTWGEGPVLVVGFADLTAQKQIEARLRQLASTDALTGVSNRRHFLEVAEATVALADLQSRTLSVVMLDVDHFKRINDRHGHAVGDQALQLVTRVCSEAVRSSDLVSRYGGEEFALLLPDADAAAALAVAERVRRRLAAQPLPAGDDRVGLAVSGGVAVRRPGESVEALVKRADDALYEAKRTGRDRVVVAP